jgi:metal-responsive CopG/Arc/MetJ family transcriptional regulator
MQQTKISLDENQLDFLNSYRELGFKDKSSLVRTAIQEFIRSFERQKLAKSAKLYAEVYKEDVDLRLLTDSAIEGWPNELD